MISKEEYQKTLIRMWDSIRDDEHKGELSCIGLRCDSCPLNYVGCGAIKHYTDVVEFVEKWAKEHPIETNGSRFLKNYPKAVVYKCDSNDDGFVYLGLDCTKPFNDENGTKFPITWWESEVDDAVNNQHS